MSYRSLSQQFEKVEAGVRQLLEDDPRLRNPEHGIALILAYWEQYNGIRFSDDLKIKILRHATDPETIRRRRQDLQTRGLYLPETPVVKELFG